MASTWEEEVCVIRRSTGTCRNGMRRTGPCARHSDSLPLAARRCWQASLAASAASLCEQSAHAYEQVLGDDGTTCDAAMVSMGNALAMWAEHCETRGDNPQAMGLLEQAAACYDSALTKTPEDVDICTNLADATMQVCCALGVELGCFVAICRRPACACVRLSPSHAAAAGCVGTACGDSTYAGTGAELRAALPTGHRGACGDSKRAGSGASHLPGARRAWLRGTRGARGGGGWREQLYMRGCSFADSRVGDDLSGLVFNWYGSGRTHRS